MMSLPHITEKYQSRSVFEPQNYIEYQRKKYDKKLIVPSLIIFCYQSSLLKLIKEKFNTKQGERCLLVSYKDKEIGVCASFGVGSPRAVLALEDMIAMGGKHFISIGSAGSLQREMAIGDVVLVDRSIRDEGCSHHYVPSEKFAYASTKMVSALENSLEDKEIRFAKGSSWTTDAPYRETIEEVSRYQKEGVLTVEMEAAALFAVAKYRQVEMGSLLMISDSLADLRWDPRFADIREKQLELFEVAIDALTRM